jgi:hypothetical protein
MRLISITAIDEGKRMRLIYHYDDDARVIVKERELPKSKPVTESIVRDYPSAEFYEREEHLFNLASAVRLFDAFGQELASYEKRLAQELEALQPPERRAQMVPLHPKPAKERAIRGRGEQEMRTTLFASRVSI